MKKLFKIVCHNTPEEIQEYTRQINERDYNILAFLDMRNVPDDDINDGLDINDTDGYLICDDEIIEVCKTFMTRFGMKYSIADISADVIKMDINFTSTVPSFKEKLHTIYKKYFTINDVLDKINEHGMDSLNEFDTNLLINN